MKRLLLTLASLLVLTACDAGSRSQPAAADPAEAETMLSAVNQSGLVLVDFYTTWCGPCKAMKPIVDSVEKDFAGKLHVVAIDCDKFPQIAGQFDVEGYPTFVIMKDGKKLETRLGGMEASRFKAWVGGFVEAAK